MSAPGGGFLREAPTHLISQDLADFGGKLELSHLHEAACFDAGLG